MLTAHTNDVGVQPLQVTLPKVLIANWAVWPAANYIAFRYITADMRILYVNVLGVRYFSTLHFARSIWLVPNLRGRAAVRSELYGECTSIVTAS